jgi:hypothetical protein
MADVTGYTDEQVARFQRELADSLARITDAIRERLRDAHRNPDGTLTGDAFNATLARELGDQIARMLGDAFAGAQDDFRATAAGLAHMVGADLEEQGLSPQLTDVSAGVIDALMGHGVDDIAAVAREAAPELRDVMRQALTTGQDPEEALNALADKLGATAAAATNLADVALMGLDRGIVVAQAAEHGAEAMSLDHPVDSLTRPWCAARANKLFRLNELDREPNDTGPQPPSVYCGGWRCRGRWRVAMPDEIAEGNFYYPQK